MTSWVTEGLNEAQKCAVESIDGPVLVIAGPGSGKTRVITHRIAYLVEIVGISPRSILAVAFTNKAANEMKSRLERLVGIRANQLTVGTFHALCASVLRRYGQHVGLDSSFAIFDDEDQTELLKVAMEETEVDLQAPHDLASQMENALQFQKTGKVERKRVNTRNILFIVSGAFANLDEIIKKRMTRHAMGFIQEERQEGLKRMNGCRMSRRKTS